MRTYIFLAAISAIVCFGLSRWLARVAAERGWAGRQDGAEGSGVPRLGGVAMLASALLALTLLLIWDNDVTHLLVQKPAEGFGLLAAVLCVFTVGLFDDLRGARPWQKLALQSAAGCILFYSGYRVDLVTNPFTGGAFTLGWLALPVTLVWLVAISNAFNLIDGLDGLAAGIGLFATVAIFLLALMSSNPFMAAIAAVLAGALLGFLPNNFAPARIYLGDSGSLTIGLTLAALAVRNSIKGPVIITLAIPLMIFGVPLLDAGVTTLRRFLSGHSIFQRDEEHLHHRLLKIGLTQRAAVLALYGVAGFFALSSLLLVNYKSSAAPLIALLCGFLAWIVVRSMDYAEFNELDEHVRIALGSQRRVLRNQIQIRKAEKLLAQARGIDEAWELTGGILETLEFESAVCHLSGMHGISSVTLRWNHPQSTPMPKEQAETWTMLIPLMASGKRLGHIELSRRLNAGSMLFRTAALTQLLSQALAGAVLRLPARISQETSVAQSKTA